LVGEVDFKPILLFIVEININITRLFYHKVLPDQRLVIYIGSIFFGRQRHTDKTALGKNGIEVAVVHQNIQISFGSRATFCAFTIGKDTTV
jgi:hypothetical protein